MTKSLKDVLARAENWPDWARQDLADLALEIDREVNAGTYRATREELRKIDEALAAVQGMSVQGMSKRASVMRSIILPIILKRPFVSNNGLMSDVFRSCVIRMLSTTRSALTS
jgi:hypothetical protein